MTVSLKEEFRCFSSDQQIALKRVINALLNDNQNVRTQFTALVAKMDGDFTDVTNASTDYASSVALSAAEITD